jgi:acyl-CoA synthetase (AMP-forming)/AMP-acid ligase II
MVPVVDEREPATLSAALRAHALDHGERLALSAGEVELSYAEVCALVASLGERLARIGAAPGERVAMLGENSVEWVVAFLACLRIGAIAVPLNHRLGPSEIEGQLRQLAPCLVLVSEEVEQAIAAAAGSCGATVRALQHDAARSIWSEPAGRLDGPLPPPDAPALIAFTSGSTGTPKGAVLTHGALAHAARAGAVALGTAEDDSTLVMAPLFHNTGYADQLAHMLVAGGSVDLLPSFGVSAARRALLRRPATYVIAVPGILRLLTLGEDADGMLAACRVAAFGGSPMPEAWIRDLEARWPRLGLYNVYGLTEFTSLSHCLHPQDLAAHGDSVGRPVEGAEQLVVGDGGEALPAGRPGRILVAGPSRMAGYWRAPDRTREVLRGRWLVTGDIGSVTHEGFLRLVGRASEVINRGGEKVSPTQVEAAVNLEPGVIEAGVVGAPHPVFGERVVAFVALEGDSSLDEDAARRHLRAHVADFAIPERFVLVDELPRTAAGKVDRLELRRHAAHALAREPGG